MVLAQPPVQDDSKVAVRAENQFREEHRRGLVTPGLSPGKDRSSGICQLTAGDWLVNGLVTLLSQPSSGRSSAAVVIIGELALIVT